MNPEIVMAAYKPKPGCESQLIDLVRQHVPLLRQLKLATDRGGLVLEGKNGSIIEVFEWKSKDAADDAHHNKLVKEHWGRLSDVCDFVAPAELVELKEQFPHFKRHENRPSRERLASRKFEKEMILSRHQQEGPFPYVLVLDNLKAGFNVPKIIRSANAMGCREVHLVNIKPFDPYPSKGTLKQTKTKSFKEFKESYDMLVAEGYTIYALVPGESATLGETPFPEKTAFILGHEEFGLSFDIKDFPEVKGLKIIQFGKVQSLNVSVAASLACFEYIRQRNFNIS